MSENVSKVFNSLVTKGRKIIFIYRNTKIRQNTMSAYKSKHLKKLLEAQFLQIADKEKS